jgi:Valyl-tRNA synthetase
MIYEYQEWFYDTNLMLNGANSDTETDNANSDLETKKRYKTKKRFSEEKLLERLANRHYYISTAAVPDLEGTLAMEEQRSLERLDEILRKRNSLIDACRSLFYAEKQQRASEHPNLREIEFGEGTCRFENHFRKTTLGISEPFVDLFLKIATKYRNEVAQYYPERKRSIFEKRIEKQSVEEFLSKVFHYPITTQLLPVLLTQFIFDEREGETIYPRMKQINSLYPRNKGALIIKMKVLAAYGEVVELIKQQEALEVDSNSSSLIVNGIPIISLQTIISSLMDMRAVDSFNQKQIEAWKSRAESSEKKLKAEKEELLLKKKDMEKRVNEAEGIEKGALEKEKFTIEREIRKINKRMKWGQKEIVKAEQRSVERATEMFKESEQDLKKKLDRRLQRNGKKVSDSERYNRNSSSITKSEWILDCVAYLCNANSYLWYGEGKMKKTVKEAIEYLSKQKVIDIAVEIDDDKSLKAAYALFIETFCRKSYKLESQLNYFDSEACDFENMRLTSKRERLVSETEVEVIDLNELALCKYFSLYDSIEYIDKIPFLVKFKELFISTLVLVKQKTISSLSQFDYAPPKIFDLTLDLFQEIRTEIAKADPMPFLEDIDNFNGIKFEKWLKEWCYNYEERVGARIRPEYRNHVLTGMLIYYINMLSAQMVESATKYSFKLMEKYLTQNFHEYEL